MRKFIKSEILVHEFFKEKIISLKEKDKVVFFMKNSEKFRKAEKVHHRALFGC